MQSTKNSQQTLSAADDLELSKVTVPEIPKDIIFPDELNRYLRDQVQYLTHQNGMLYKNLSDVERQVSQSESKITSLTSQLDEYQTTCPKNSLASSTANLASGKIVELSKKLRERNSEVEVYKTKCSRLEKYILELENHNDNVEASTSVTKTDKPKNELEEKIKVIQDKLNGTNMKLCEVRNANTQLKNDLKMANRLLLQEVGDSFENIQAAVSATANWRGRAQIICDLQQKNSDLREKLKTNQEKEKVGRTNIETPIQIMRQDKRLESLAKENDELKDVVQATKRKLDAAKARTRVLESESVALRAKVLGLSEQSNCNHHLITSLTAKVASAQETQSEALQQKQAIVQKTETENKNLHMELAKQKCKLENLDAQVEDQKREIERLREKIRTQQPLSPLKPVIEGTPKINQLEAERIRLLELTKLANDRLDTERSNHAITQAKLRSERQKGAKFEAKIARLQLDHQTDRSSTYSFCSSKSKDLDSTVGDRLQLAEETVRALETRLQVERQEHKTDIEEFTGILRNYGYIENVGQSSS